MATLISNRATASDTAPGRTRDSIFWVAVALLVIVTGATRLWAPWRFEVINDEMLHQESWRNRYGTADMHPLFRDRLDQSKRIPQRAKEILLETYQNSRLFQYLLFIYVDCSSPMYSGIAEAIRALTHSLLAQRLFSLLLSLFTVAVAYRMGLLVRDHATGLCMAMMFALSPLSQVYAGVARAHGLAQFTIVLLLYVVAKARCGQASLAAVLGAALLVQLSHWAAWIIAGPIVVAEWILFFVQWRSVRMLLRKSWWYILASIVLLAVFWVQALGTSALGNLNYASFAVEFEFFSVAGPVALLSPVSNLAIPVSGAVILVLFLVGVLSLYRRNGIGFAATLLFTSAGAFLAVFFMGHQRHMMIYGTVFLAGAGFGLRALFPTIRAASLGASVILLVLGSMSLAYPEDPYRFILNSETRYSFLAQYLKDSIREGEQWAAVPYYIGSCLYRFGPLPEPVPTYRLLNHVQSFDFRANPQVRYLVATPDAREQLPATIRIVEMYTCPYQRYAVFKVEPRANDSSANGAS